MKRKNMILVGTLVAGISLFTVTALASSGQNDGYEMFKEALKQTSAIRDHRADSNMEGQFEVVDNGVSLFAVTGNVGIEEDGEEVGGSMTLIQGSVSKDLEFYESGDTTYVKDVETEEYYSFQGNHDEYERHYKDRDQRFNHQDKWTESGENIMDAIIGKYQDQFELSTSSTGEQMVSFDLTKDEVPSLLNLMIAEAAKNENNYHRNSRGTSPEDFVALLPFLEGFDFDEDQLPKLVDEVAFERITLRATLDDQKVMTGHDFYIVITGLDEQGDAHTLEFKGNMSFLEDTAVEPMDTNGKDITEIVVPDDWK